MLKNIKICYFARALSPWQIGGVETHVYEIIKRLNKKNFEIHVICDKNYYPKNKYYMNIKELHIHFVEDYPSIPNISYSIRAGFKALELDKVVNFDLFHGHGIYGLGFALLKLLGFIDKPFITTIHNVIFRDAQSVLKNIKYQKNKIFNNLINFLGLTIYSLLEGLIISRTANAIITVSQYTKKDAIKTYRLNKNKIKVIYNGISLNKFTKKIKNKTTNKINKKAPIILFVGRLSYRKGIHTLISSIPLVKEHYPDIQYIIIGEGELKKQLIEQSKRLGIYKNIVFLDHVKSKELPNYFHNSDIFVYPSLWEGFGLTIIEAMASGTPVISTNISAIPEIIIDNKTGFLIDVENHKKLAQKTLKILNKEKYTNEIKKQAKNHVIKKFQWDDKIKKITQLYFYILTKQKK